MTSYKSKILPFPRPFMITPVAGLETINPYFLNAAQQLVDALIPHEFWLSQDSDWQSASLQLSTHLPLFNASDVEDDSTTLTISYLCPDRPGVRLQKYVRDTISHKLGISEWISSMHLSFQFAQDPGMNLLVGQETIPLRSFKECVAIRRKLPELLEELKSGTPKESFRSPNIVHPIFMPRNEEEMIRGLIMLASQIKYVKDLPQVSIHYEKQTEVDLTFTVIAASLLKGKKEPLRKRLEKSRLKIDIDHVRVMGSLHQKYPKEAAIVHITIDKQPFFRADHSVDLLRARQKIALEIHELLGEFRDYNGGMILKQNESLKTLRRELGALDQEKDLLLENYFYSLKPAIAQTIHDPLTLKAHFEQLSSLKDFSIQKTDKFLLTFILCDKKEKVLKALEPLQLSPHDLTTCVVELRNKTAVGCILRADSSEIAQTFESVLRSCR